MSQLDNMLKRESFKAEIDLHDVILEKDLETNNTEVTRYWLPESFEWFKDTRPLIIVSKTSIRITEAAAELANFQSGCIINIGVNKGFVAFNEDSKGLRAKLKGSTAKGLYISGQKTAKLFEKYGYILPCQMMCYWDEKNEMLVAQKPSMKENAHEESGRKDHRDLEQVQRKRNTTKRSAG